MKKRHTAEQIVAKLREAEMEGVRIELSDQRGRGVVLGAQLRDREQRLEATRSELAQAQASVGRLQAELTSKAADRDRLAAELVETQWEAAGGLLVRLWRGLVSTRPSAKTPGQPAL